MSYAKTEFRHHLNSNTTAKMGQSAAVPIPGVAAAIPSNTHVVNSTNTNPANVATTARQALPRRRKRKGHGWTRKKSYKNPSPHRENYQFNPRRRYKIRGIKAEDETRYLIKWARTDSQGNDFLDSWVPKKALSMKGYTQKKKYANNRAVRDWETRKRLGRERFFNDAPGEYDTEGAEYVTSDSEQEEQQQAQEKEEEEREGWRCQY